MTAPIAVGLSAVIVAADEEAPYALVTRDADGAAGLPHGRFDPLEHRTFELGLREWVQAQTGFELGYVEQLYTFGDKGRELPQADLGDAPKGARLISVGYLGLTPERTDISKFEAVWRDWYRFFPWEDHRGGRPASIDEVFAPALARWADAGGRTAAARLDRVRISFGLDGRPWIEERTLERYELLYEAGLAPEAVRDRSGARARIPAQAQIPGEVLGEPMISDHRRILATALGRLRGKIKYRPVVFELMGEAFTLSNLQRTVEALLGQRLHKQNFRRALDKSGLVEGLGRFTQATGGRPAELFRFRRAALREGSATGVQAPRGVTGPPGPARVFGSTQAIPSLERKAGLGPAVRGGSIHRLYARPRYVLLRLRRRSDAPTRIPCDWPCDWRRASGGKQVPRPDPCARQDMHAGGEDDRGALCPARQPAAIGRAGGKAWRSVEAAAADARHRYVPADAEREGGDLAVGRGRPLFRRGQH